MVSIADIFATIVNQNTLGGIILAAFFTIVGLILKGALNNHGSITVARINSDTTLGAKAMETLTTAIEVLQEENKSLRAKTTQLESHIDTLIEYILIMVKAKSQEEVDRAVSQLEQFLKAIGKWPY
jgi:cell division protein FtsB